MGRLEGKTAFITGSGAGIGRASAVLFASEGAKVAVVELDTVSGQKTVDLIRENGGVAEYFQTDITDESSVEQTVQAVRQSFGKINVLYNNAGGSTNLDDRVSDAPVDEFWRKIRLDLFGTWLCCRYVIPEIIEAGGGSVINSTSVFALRGTHKKDAYTAAKGGVSALTRSMAVEYGEYGIRVNAVAPAATRTERVQRMIQDDDGIVQRTLSRQFLGWSEPTDIANAALFLASDESRVITGQILAIDGGFTVS